MIPKSYLKFVNLHYRTALKIMVMTIASFNKASNIIRQSTDRLQGEKPINLIKATRPILILDEPQRMESNLSVESLSSLSSTVCAKV